MMRAATVFVALLTNVKAQRPRTTKIPCRHAPLRRERGLFSERH